MTWRKWYGIDIVISYCLPSYNPKSSGLEAIAGVSPLVEIVSGPRVIDLFIRPCFEICIRRIHRGQRSVLLFFYTSWWLYFVMEGLKVNAAVAPAVRRWLGDRGSPTRFRKVARMSHDDERIATDNKPGRFPCSSSSPQYSITARYRTGGGDAFPDKLLSLPLCETPARTEERQRGAIGKSRGRRETKGEEGFPGTKRDESSGHTRARKGDL
jgi:hypothetical protein